MPSTARTDAPGPETERRNRAAYRPHLDGLRTVAVYLVVAYHAGLGLVNGGFIGVDVFFVLSGFLVTQILVRDLASSGRMRFQQFYSRRSRRILPAAVLALVITAIVYAAIASPAESLDALGGFKAAFLYVANWDFIRQSTDYFAANINSNPVLHFWSLAVEEQFYLVWPLVLGALFYATRPVGRHRWWVLRIVVVAAGAASVIAAVHIGSTNLDRAYYGTDTRAYQLLAGATLALTPQLLAWGDRSRRVARAVSLVAIGAVLVLATSAFSMSPITRGIYVAVAVVVLLAALENTRGGVVEQVLSWSPFTYLGRISYGIYLWHWPVIVIAAHGRSLSPLALFAISVAVATPLAALSFHLLEHPVRSARLLDGLRIPIIASGLAVSIVCGLVVMPAILDSGSPSVSALTPGGVVKAGPKLLDWRVAKNDIPALPDCLGKPVQKCTVESGNGLRVVLMGDSNARMWIPTFTEIGKERGWTLSVLSYPTCPWQARLEVLYQSFAACKAHQADWYARVVPALDPDLIILVHQGFDAPARPLPFVTANGSIVRGGQPAYEPALTNASATALGALARAGRQLVILEPTPDAPPGVDPLACLSGGTAPAKCSFQANTVATPLERYYRSQTGVDGVTSVDLDRLVCPRWPTCDAIVGQVIARRDGNHLTATFARVLAPEVAARLPKR